MCFNFLSTCKMRCFHLKNGTWYINLNLKSMSLKTVELLNVQYTMFNNREKRQRRHSQASAFTALSVLCTCHKIVSILAWWICWERGASRKGISQWTAGRKREADGWQRARSLHLTCRPNKTWGDNGVKCMKNDESLFELTRPTSDGNCTPPCAGKGNKGGTLLDSTFFAICHVFPYGKCVILSILRTEVIFENRTIRSFKV